MRSEPSVDFLYQTQFDGCYPRTLKLTKPLWDLRVLIAILQQICRIRANLFIACPASTLTKPSYFREKFKGVSDGLNFGQ